MQRGRPKAQLIVPPEDLATLQRWTARRKTAQALALRSQILLRCASGLSNTEVARELGVVNATVGKWRSRYIAKGLAGLLDEQRCGAPRRIGDDQVEAVLVKTLETTPRDATHWSTRSMAAGTGLSRPTINRIWRAFGLQPHRAESFKLSNDPQFIEKVRDIVGLYLNPPERALVLCTDEKACASDYTPPSQAPELGAERDRSLPSCISSRPPPLVVQIGTHRGRCGGGRGQSRRAASAQSSRW